MPKEYEDPIVGNLIAIYNEAVRSVQADRLLEGLDLNKYLSRSIDSFERIVVVGAGKAAMAMGGVLEYKMGQRVDCGLLTIPHGYKNTLPSHLCPPARLDTIQAGHPIPDAQSVAAARQTAKLAKECGPNDLLLVLLSGGASALWTYPHSGIRLPDIQMLNQLLLKSGATINEINSARKHLTLMTGGRLAQMASPANVLTLVLSDVVGNDLSTIASGPTSPDPTTFEDALVVLSNYGIASLIPVPIWRHLKEGAAGTVEESPKPGSEYFASVTNVLVGDNGTALAAAKTAAEQLGYTTKICSVAKQGSASQLGKEIVSEIVNVESDQPVCLLWGGESEVDVQGQGKGGRNQEVVLSAAIELHGSAKKIQVFSGGTDGIDGPTDAAGAWCSPDTVQKGRQAGIVAVEYLKDNDAYSFFSHIDQLFKPGPTHTNVMDLQIALFAP